MQDSTRDAQQEANLPRCLLSWLSGIMCFVDAVDLCSISLSKSLFFSSNSQMADADLNIDRNVLSVLLNKI